MSENRKQIIEKIAAAENILITVSKSPSVDALAAALGLTIALNKTGKRATAVTSGEMPDALKFLRPEKTFENSVDSLRDFIIALNKEKADHLRYKVVGDHVKIFITPYRTTLTSGDLEFEQGDFNVDLVLAIGVRDKTDLDSALAAHGRIFHDATVGVLTVGEQASSLSDINWHNFDAGSLSEIALELVLGIDSKILNKSVATAFLTGIVAATERFSNEKATANVMNLASRLITAGADQQLVISKIKEAEEKAKESPKNESKNQPDNLRIPKDEPVEINDEPSQIDSISISHGPIAEVEPELKSTEVKVKPNIHSSQPAKATAEDELEASLNQLSMQNFDTPLSEEEVSELANPTSGLQFETTMPAFPAEEIISTLKVEQPEINVPQISTPADSMPQLPESNEPTVSETAFISEEPITTTEFKPVEKPEILKTGDDYYHPEENQQAKAKILKHTSPINPEQMAPREKAEPEPQEFIPSPESHGIGQTVQPTQPAPQVQAEVANQLPPVQIEAYGGFPPPPPIPDFSKMPLPPEFNLPPVAMPNIQPEVAVGVEASAKNIMTDQIYPTPPNNDPAQFKIPGMQ